MLRGQESVDKLEDERHSNTRSMLKVTIDAKSSLVVASSGYGNADGADG